MIEQVTDPKTGLQYAIVCCPQQRELYVSRFVVCTASVGIMHNSLRFNGHLAARHGHMLQQRQPYQQPPYKTALGITPAREGTESAESEESWLNEASSAAGAAASHHFTLLTPAAQTDRTKHLDVDPSSPLVHQLEAAILFHPPLSQHKVEAFERVGMGLENKVSVQRWRLDPAQRGHISDCGAAIQGC